MASKQSHKSVAVSPQEADDFKLISGIGPVLDGRLHEAGIRTYSQLASLSPAELATKVNGLSVKQITRLDWIGQARKMVPKKARPKPHQKRQEAPTIRQHYENFTIEFLLDEKNTVRRSRAVHVQSGYAETWAGWEAQQLIDFLARHIKERIPKAKSSSKESSIVPLFYAVTKEAQQGNKIAESSSQSQEAINLTGTLRVHDLQVVTIGSNIPLFALHHEQPYLLRLTIDLSKVDASSETPLVYQATIIVKQLGGLDYVVTEAISNLKLSDSMTLGIVGPVLPPGIYRLAACVILSSDKAASSLTAILKGDLLQIY